MTYQRYENESEDELIYRICKDKELIGTWEDVKDILNELLSQNYNESTYRKKYNAFVRMFTANQKNFDYDSKMLSEINLQKRELQKERYKLSTEKLENNRWLRENARDELIIEKISEIVKKLEKYSFPPSLPKTLKDKEYVLLFGDEHFGIEFEIKGLMGEIINSYSPEIFFNRMKKLLQKVKELIVKENIDTLHIFNMGDFCDGILRVSQLMKLRYGVIDSTIIYADYISQWLNELSKSVNIKFQMVNGNHSELRMIGQPKGTFTEDNVGKIVKAFIKIRLSGNPNFEFIDNPSGYIYSNICGYNVVGIHGEVSNMKNTIRNFTDIYNKKINYLIAGHLHHSKMEEVGVDSEVINTPSVMGFDPYGLSLEKTSKSSAKLLVFEEDNGKVCEYTLNLK